jgi:hypothetical protein
VVHPKREWHKARFEETKHACRIFVGKPEGRRELRRLKYGQEDNIKINLKYKGYVGVDWIHLAWDRDQRRALMNMVMTFQS